MKNQVQDPFHYIAELAKKDWEVCAGYIGDGKFFYLMATGHGQVFVGTGDDLIHAYLEMMEEVQNWEREQDDIDWKDEQDTKQSLIADTRQA